MRRGKKTIENPDFSSFVVRCIRAQGKRISEDPANLRQFARILSEVDRALGAAVLGLRQRGYSWAAIANELGVSKQAVQKRFGSLCSEVAC